MIIRDIIVIILFGYIAKILPKIEISIKNKHNNFYKITFELCVAIRIILVLVFIITLIRFSISGTYHSMFDAIERFLHIRLSEI